MDELTELIITMAFAVILIFANGYIRCKYGSGTDLLMHKLNIYDLDGWSVMHFSLFAYIGYRFPTRIVEAMILGISWEIWEDWCGDTRPSWMGGFGDCNLTTDQTDSTHQNWWFGRYSDIIINLLGFLFGKYIKNNQ